MSSPPVCYHLNDLADSRPPPPATPAITNLRSLLHQLIRVSTSDGRIFIGTFAGTDKQLNIILTNTEEFRVAGSDALPEGRYVSLVLVPWKFITTVEASSSSWTQDHDRETSSMYL